jgi:hypothetical protein
MAKPKGMNIAIDPTQVVYTSIMKDKSGFNSARMVIKAGDKEYLQISYDWEGSSVPDFALNLMDFMKSSSVETSGVWPGQEVAYTEYEESKCGSSPMKKKKKKKMDEEAAEMCPDCGKPMKKCECEDDDEEDAAKKKMAKCPDCGKPMPFCSCDKEGKKEDKKEDKKSKK